MALSILREAIKAVPATKYALAVAGVVAAIAIIKSLSVDLRVAGFGTVIMLIMMAGFVVFARVAALGRGDLRLPALVLTWFALALIIAISIVLFTSVLFKEPIDLQEWVKPHPEQLTVAGTALAPPPPATAAATMAQAAHKQESAPQEGDDAKEKAKAMETKRAEQEVARKKEARREMLSSAFDQLRGAWIRGGIPHKKVMFNAEYVGTCAVISQIDGRLSFELLDQENEEIKGKYSFRKSESADFTAPDIPGLDSSAPNGNCNNYATSDMYMSERTLKQSGTVTAVLDEDDSGDIILTEQTTSCTINGEECDSNKFGDSNTHQIQHLDDGKIKIDKAIFRRDDQ